MSEWLDLFKRFLPDFIIGAGVTLELTFIELLLGFILGLGLALANPWITRACSSGATTLVLAISIETASTCAGSSIDIN